jgi:hypothetical protein
MWECVARLIRSVRVESDEPGNERPLLTALDFLVDRIELLFERPNRHAKQFPDLDGRNFPAFCGGIRRVAR